jgi:phosphoglycolate phosphatase
VGTVVCWDIDGTLLTTARAGILAVEDAVREVCGVDADFGGLRTSGLTDAEVTALAAEVGTGERVDPATANAVLRAYERHLPERLPLRNGTVLPGVREILDDLAARPEVTCLLLTGNTATGAEAKLSHYRLWEYFAAGGAFCRDGEDRETIAGRARKLAGRYLNGAGADDRVFVVGDSPADVRCGRAIGARAIAVASGVHAVSELEACEPWLILERLPEPEHFAHFLGLEAAS